VLIPQLPAGSTYSIDLDIGGVTKRFQYASTAQDTLADVLKQLARAVDLDLNTANDGVKRYHSAVLFDTVVFTSGWTGTPPAAGSGYYFAPLNANTVVVESEQVDVLNVRNANSQT